MLRTIVKFVLTYSIVFCLSQAAEHAKAKEYIPIIVDFMLDDSASGPDVSPPDVVLSCPTSSSETLVSNRSELLSALANSSGGDSIVLQNGNYGSVDIRNEFSSHVCLVAQNLHQARFEEIDMSNSKYIFLNGLNINGELEAERSSYAVVKNSKMASAVFKFSDNARYDGNDSRYVNFNDSAYFEITNNYIHHASSDLLHLKGNAHHFLVENNFLYDTIPDEAAHSDGIQMAGNRNGTPHHFTLRGNYVFDDPATVQPGAESANKKLQGFFIADANGDGYHNILIEDNLINASNTANSIIVAGVSHNVVIRNNTLLPTAAGSGGGIRITEFPGATHQGIMVAKNVADSPRYGTAPSVQEDDNIFYNLRGAKIELDTLFENPSAFGTWRNFIPKAGGQIDFDSGYGAERRVRQLQMNQ